MPSIIDEMLDQKTGPELMAIHNRVYHANSSYSSINASYVERDHSREKESSDVDIVGAKKIAPDGSYGEDKLKNPPPLSGNDTEARPNEDYGVQTPKSINVHASELSI